MLLIAQPRLSNPERCPYLQEKLMRVAYFYACEVDSDELEKLLSCGWRKFGAYFFRPQCQDCSYCIPVRVPVNSFTITKGQRRLWRANQDLDVRIEEDPSIDQLFEIYQDHSLNRFGLDANRTEFENNFFVKSCPSAYSLYYYKKMLIAAGFLDISCTSLSSVYFIYRSEYLDRGLGNFSILKEIQLTAELGMMYYYLGYYVKGNSRMQYKIRYSPYQWFDWEKGEWQNSLIERGLW